MVYIPQPILAKKSQKEAGGDKKSDEHKHNTTFSPNGQEVKGTHTRKEIAKIAGVGTGTVARFNQVMKSGDEEVVKK